jgi:hypothetical protein
VTEYLSDRREQERDESEQARLMAASVRALEIRSQTV